MTRILTRGLALLAVSLALLSACDKGTSSARPGPKVKNSVAAYLHNAELQFETPAQGAEIRRALTDMLNLTPGLLRERRYADYQMTPDAWDVPTLLSRYFVPEKADRVLREKTFYEEVDRPEARLEIDRQLRAVEKALAG